MMARGRRRHPREKPWYDKSHLQTSCKGCGKIIFVMRESEKKDAKCVSCGIREMMSRTPAQWEALKVEAMKIDAANAAKRRKKK